MAGTRQPVKLDVWMELHSPDRLRRHMERKGWSQRGLAQAAGWKGHAHLSRLLSGKEKNVDPVAALRLAYALDVPVDDFFVTRVSSDPRPLDMQMVRSAA